MTTLIAMLCLGNCGTTVRRKPSRRGSSLPLCKTDFNRAHEAMKATPLLDEQDAEMRRWNRFWSDQAVVIAALAEDRMARR